MLHLRGENGLMLYYIINTELQKAYQCNKKNRTTMALLCDVLQSIHSIFYSWPNVQTAAFRHVGVVWCVRFTARTHRWTLSATTMPVRQTFVFAAAIATKTLLRTVETACGVSGRKSNRPTARYHRYTCQVCFSAGTEMCVQRTEGENISRINGFHLNKIENCLNQGAAQCLSSQRLLDWTDCSNRNS